MEEAIFSLYIFPDVDLHGFDSGKGEAAFASAVTYIHVGAILDLNYWRELYRYRTHLPFAIELDSSFQNSLGS